jgi:hypothetical protein
MKKQAVRLLVPGIVAVVLAGVSVLSAAVKTDHDKNANFERYHTYSWIKVDAADSLWVNRIQSAVDSALQAKGWQRVESGGDAAVSAFGRVHNEQTLTTFYDGIGGGWYWRGFGGVNTATTTVENTPVGSLVVHIFDGGTKHLIWEGTSSDTLSDKPEKNEKKMEKSVDEMFSHFPPKR